MRSFSMATHLSMLTGALLATISPVSAKPEIASVDLSDAARQAEQSLRQSFANLRFEAFAPAPVKGPLYQAIAGGKVIYYAPESENILFAAVYDKNGVNLTALAQDASARTKLDAIDPAKALVIGSKDAPTIIEFTDPDCPYCRALEKFWAVKEAEGKHVRRLIYFVSGIHPQAAAKAEHILCAPDPAAAFKAIYAGASPKALAACPAGQAKIKAHTDIVRRVGVGGTPTLIVDGRVISGFQQAELEAFLAKPGSASEAPQPSAPHQPD